MEQVWDSIRRLKVRGAPAIGIAGAYGLLVGLRQHRGGPLADFLSAADRLAAYLDSSRPTAVNLLWALERMKSRPRPGPGGAARDAAELWAQMAGRPSAIHDEDAAICRAIGEHGVALHPARHAACSPTATPGRWPPPSYGTAARPCTSAHERG